MKKILFLILCILCSFGKIFASSSEFTYGDLKYRYETTEPLDSDGFRRCEISGKTQTGSYITLDMPDTFTYSGQKYKVVGIAGSAFSGSGNLSYAPTYTIKHWPSYLEHIGWYAFAYVKFNDLEIPGNVAINDYAFYYSQISGLKLNENTKIGEGAFIGGNNLFATLIIPEGCEIGEDSFTGCNKLAYLTLPSTLTEIGSGGFRNTTSLLDVWCYATTPPKCINSNTFQNVVCSGVRLHVPKGTADLYKAADVWKEFYIIDDLENEEESSNGDFSGIKDEDITQTFHMVPEETKNLALYLNDLEASTWESSDEEKVSVSSDGLITAKNLGRSYILAKDAEGKTVAVFEVFVCPTVTVEHGTGVIYNHHVLYNSRPTLTLTAPNGYRLAGVTHDKKDVTEFVGEDGKYVPAEPLTDNSVINIALQQIGNGPTTGLTTTLNDPDIHIYVNGHTVNIVGVDNNTVVRMYNLDGKVLLDQKNRPDIEVIDAGIYLIGVDGQPNLYKILVR